MNRSPEKVQKTKAPTAAPPYRLDDQVGFILRQVAQRHAALFASGIGADITSTQWAALAKLHEAGALSQNLLGRQTAMDAATIKGVIDRLCRRGLTETRQDPDDGRRLLVALTGDGAAMVEGIAENANRITEETLAPLSARERRTLTDLLLKLR